MNRKNDDKWLKDLRNRMDNYAEPLPEGLWEQLESELSQPKVIPFWRRWPSVAAAVALVLVVTSLALSDLFTPVMQMPEVQLANQLVEEAEPALAVATPQAEDTPTPVVAQAEPVVAQAEPVVAQAARVEAQEAAVVAQETAVVEPVDRAQDEPTEQVSTAPQGSRARFRSSERTRRTNETSYSVTRRHHRSDKGLEIGLMSGGIPYGSSKQFTGMSRLATPYVMNRQDQLVMGSMNGKMSAYSQVLLSNRDKPSHTDVKHKMPINVVASVKWHFAEKWALESGISYTYLQSELHSGSNLYWEESQKLHYVGIPLKLHRALWENSALTLYASAGGMLEKCVKGTLESVYVTSNSTKERETNTIHSHPFQWSLAAAVGAQVNLLDQLSLFVEPGIAYYFDDHSRLETIRKEHPFNFNLQFGLRLNFSR